MHQKYKALLLALFMKEFPNQICHFDHPICNQFWALYTILPKKPFDSNFPLLLVWSGGQNYQIPHACCVTKEPHKLINMFYEIVNHLSLLTVTRSVMTQYSLSLLTGYMIPNWPVKLYLQMLSLQSSSLSLTCSTLNLDPIWLYCKVIT